MNEISSVKVALAGNPNAGKTSIFNALTGARQHVGNYPGVTVEKREGIYCQDRNRFDVIDLPGTYSLASFSPEEQIAQDELLNGKPDVVVVIVDSTTLERSLVFLAQVMQLGANPVLCLNMSDEAEKVGQIIDLKLLRDLLGFPVVQTTGHKGIGVDHLKAAVVQAVTSPITESRLVLGRRLDVAVAAILEELVNTELDPASFGWVAIRLLCGDQTRLDKVRSQGQAGEKAIERAANLRARIEAQTGQDISLFLMERYYGFVDGLLKEVLKTHARIDSREVSDRIDSILVNRILGIPFFLAVMYAIFWLTFTLGEYPIGWLESGFSILREWVANLWSPKSETFFRSLLVDGIIGGVGGVVVFLPNIVLLFLGLAFLEDTGYMARAAFIVDHLMHRFGLHGKSFIPMVTGFGCSIPGIMATRTLENEKDRLTTMLVLPLMSCGARLPIWMLLIPAFFSPAWQAPMLWIIYMIGILLALVLALILRKSILKGIDAPFVMELPPYRLPTIRAIVVKMVERSWVYLRKAGTVILGISILMWFLTSYPKPDKNENNNPESQPIEELEHRQAARDLRYSIAGRIGGALEPLIKPLGFDWKIGTAIIGAFAAKEVFVSQLGIVYSLGETNEESESLRDLLREAYSPLTGLSLMLFMLISAPCMATIAVTRRESGSWKWAILQLGGLTIIAYIISLIVYQIGSLMV
ncbi:MAG: ferrous iron transport protein B [Deltaproteobacteria bacterium]|nr:ferrous iron transport protein B [Deltaproteobacteria bacterium]MBW1871387.1 ferrous iron transport protein B [Deltaproteobacteria bacterium]